MKLLEKENIVLFSKKKVYLTIIGGYSWQFSIQIPNQS